MSFNSKFAVAHAPVLAVLLILSGALALGGCKPSSDTKSDAKTGTYQFELVGQPQNKAPGVAVVSVRLVHLPDKKPAPNAVIFETRADMGPDGMGAMTAPVKALPESEPGTYRFEIEFGSVWDRPGGWALTLAAKIQGETETVRGKVTFTLEP